MDKVIYEQCTGEAHRNPYIDHCGGCVPYWEFIPCCPVCSKMVHKKRRWSSDSHYWFWCTTCRRHFEDNITQLKTMHTARCDS